MGDPFSTPLNVNSVGAKNIISLFNMFSSIHFNNYCQLQGEIVIEMVNIFFYSNCNLSTLHKKLNNNKNGHWLTLYIDKKRTGILVSNFVHRYPLDNRTSVGELIAAANTGWAYSGYVLDVRCRACPFVADICSAHSRLKNYGYVKRTRDSWGFLDETKGTRNTFTKYNTLSDTILKRNDKQRNKIQNSVYVS